MNFSFSEFWTALQKCRQMNADFNGGFFSLDAAVELYARLRLADSLEDALAELSVSENPNTAIWTECESCFLAKEANEQGFGSVLEYARTFPECYMVAPDRWLLRCE
ncbi:MAG: hypothetical protein J6U20_04115 [Fibrobacter sp.]|nr:hypothetical protein [Fibrobacter sp.]